jgi:tetratricopeptide (TPR) repeat protein
MGCRVALASLVALVSAAGAGPPPTFAHDVAPIVYRFCAPCHHAGGEGPFPLMAFQDVQKRAAQIATVTHRRYMPPWLPEPGYGAFQNELRLTDEQVRLIGDWVAAGAPEGPPGETPPAPQFLDGWRLGEPDLVLNAAAPVEVAASGPDLFWNFLFTPKLEGARYVRAVEIRPGSRQIVHHANLLIDRAGSAHRATAEGGAGGFPGMDLAIVRSPYDPDGHFLFWKPGAPTHEEPDGFAWRLNPGDTLVLNTHLHPSGKLEQAQPSVGIYFTDQAPTHFPLLIQLEHDGALRIPAGARDFSISDEFHLPMDVTVVAVYPHAHYLGKLLEAFATLPDGTRKWLIRIPDWDWRWQSVYYYQEPLVLPKGSVISMRYHYDNSADNVRNPHHPPRVVQNGNETTDEMGHLWLEVLPHPDTPGARLVLQEAVMRRRLEKYPDDFTANLNLGALAMARLDIAGAVSMLENAVRLDPGRPDAHNMLGAALARVGRVTEAIEQLRAAVRERPDFLNARLNLANVLMRAGKLEESIENYHKVLTESGGDPTARAAVETRARQLEEEGKTAAAAALFHELSTAPPGR